MARRLLGTALGALLVAAAGAGALAHVYNAGSIDVLEPWARATLPGMTIGAGYVTIRSQGRNDDRLVRVEVEVADRVELHETTIEGGIARMRFMADGVVIPGGGTVELKPDGLHMMLIGLKKPLKAPGQFFGSLHFEKAGKVDLEFEVVPLGQTPHAH